MRPLAHITEDRSGAFVVAVVEGEIDASNAPRTGTRLRSLISNQSAGMIVDLTGTTYLDSAGIALLFTLAAELRAHQQRLRLVISPASPITRTLTLTGLAASVPIHETVDAATRAT